MSFFFFLFRDTCCILKEVEKISKPSVSREYQKVSVGHYPLF